LQYDRAVTMHRLMAGGEPEMPGGLEQQRMLAGILAAIEPVEALEPQPNMLKRLERWLAPVLLGAAALAAVLLVSRGSIEMSIEMLRATPEEEYVGMRGEAFALTVGLGVSGVTADGREYEVVEADGTLYFDDYLRLTTTRAIDTHPYVMLVGLQAGNAPVWYAPDPEHDGPGSVAVAMGFSKVLGGDVEPVEFHLAGGRHRTGELTVMAVFSDAPISRAAIEPVVNAPNRDLDSLTDQVRNVAAVGSTAIIRVLKLRVVSGSREGTDR
ncbi:MAG: hypothetical protein ACI9WU_005107, partial [Myxococcota bacterium]